MISRVKIKAAIAVRDDAERLLGDGVLVDGNIRLAEQRFYLSYATIWGQNIRDEEAARLTKVDVHSLGKNRVNATLRNVATFYEAFGITDGAMFLPEEERVVIW